jgi:hypothetical protein
MFYAFSRCGSATGAPFANSAVTSRNLGLEPNVASENPTGINHGKEAIQLETRASQRPPQGNFAPEIQQIQRQ